MFETIALVLAASQAHTPLETARQALDKSLGNRASNVLVRVDEKLGKESYSIRPSGRTVVITGGDQTGAMYGCFEFIERTQTNGERTWKESAKGRPYLPDRGVNLFLTLPWDYSKHDTDYSLSALTDPEKWWFHNEDYWTTLLDLMARSRLNWLDIHGAWDISVTDAPNLYAYFVTSPSFPQVGVPQATKDANLSRLNTVIQMAHARGIRVSLMAYQANLKIPQNRNVPYEETEANVYKYTKEVVEQMIRRAPGLDAIGFRIGESGKSESFFNCYHEAVKASGRDIPLVTRSWITKRQKVLPLARASKDFTVEIKYNGEQWGAPYMIAGGRMANWSSYSYEDYLSDAGSPSRNTKTWPGWADGRGGQWPSNPYKIVWQVRANGTHRIFPFYNPDWVRRSIQAMKVGTASGYTIEGEDAYYPKSPDYYLAKAGDKYCNWIHQRDEMYWTTWGRLGYDPTLTDEVFDKRAASWFGKNGSQIVDSWKHASLVTPTAFLASAYGPDHRDHAPELEWNGPVRDLAQMQPFDSFAVKSVAEEVLQENLGVSDGRLTTVQLFMTQASNKLIDWEMPGDLAEGNRFKEIAAAVSSLNGLGHYSLQRLMIAKDLAEQERDHPVAARSTFVKGMAESIGDWWELLGKGYYKPFTERLRMHTNTFHWKDEAAAVEQDSASLLGMPKSNQETLGKCNFQAPMAHAPKLNVEWDAKEVRCELSAKGLNRAWALVKPLPSSTFFHRIPMTKSGSSFSARWPRQKWGSCVAAEFKDAQGIVERSPMPILEQPYVMVPSLPGPTPQVYNTSEALAFLDPAVLTPSKFSSMLLAPRAWTFFNNYDRASKRKVLDGVRKGLDLVILQQDFASGRYKLDFLPVPPKVENCPTPDVFEPAGALGLPRVEAPGILWQRIGASQGWTILGNGGVARYDLGQGHVWLVMGRFMQMAHRRGCSQAIKSLLESHGRAKPMVLLDAGTESAAYTTSFWPDTMNVLDVPFLTLGEVVANEQGMSSFTPIPGPIADDDVLGGKGKDMANSFFRSEVQRLSKQPTPPSRQAFETERKRRKTELLRTLGLDPMPSRTPLNARVTGVIQREGYHIEKVVFESRPKFYVTAHVYRADHPAEPKLPVIMNVNGHWAHKKDEDRIQLRCAFQALHGYIAIAIDSPGWSFEGDSLIERRGEGSHFEFKMVEGGTNATGYYVWDAIRAMDYMETRPDTDMAHAGITGASGGGLATLYAFAADARYRAAVPVVYMSSMELAPDNGCPCNHVPGTCQIGDRSDVISVQAPKPVLIMGAEQDGEFPPGAMRLTQKKMAETWALFGSSRDAQVLIFPGGHDYSQPMREAAIGFFDKYVRGVGDGSPVPQPALTALAPEDRQLLVLDPAPKDERTMMSLAAESLAAANLARPAGDAIAVNGGRPAKSPLNFSELGTGPKRTVTFESEPGLKTPGILVMPAHKPKKVVIVVDDRGKATACAEAPKTEDARLYLDTVGLGELAGVEIRYPVYAGRSLAFIGGWQVVRAAEAMRKYTDDIEIVGKGPLASLTVMYAGLLDPTIGKVTGLDGIKDWADTFSPEIPDSAIQPRANLCGSLSGLRKQVHKGTWTFAPR
ncbi:MAG: prolyl oligopeptidase family serine peptidase [Armatimonadetes bacterium]|nr:prolyl oligopeptidase family serine peptidase [Armatimonadota bacterium]